jgi:hypothetical protein
MWSYIWFQITSYIYFPVCNYRQQKYLQAFLILFTFFSYYSWNMNHTFLTRRARYEDAKFFYEMDTRKKFSEFRNQLDGILFHVSYFLLQLSKGKKLLMVVKDQELLKILKLRLLTSIWKGVF